MKRRLPGFLICAAGFVLLISARRFSVTESWLNAWTSVTSAMGCVLLLAGGAILRNARSGNRRPDLLRLEWFLPFLRTRRKTEPQTSQALRHWMWLPNSWHGERETGRSGWLRKTLSKIGPSVVASPMRRAVQTVCLLVFLSLFFYVCWPYTARPDPPGQQSRGWKFMEIDQQSGAFLFSHDHPPAWATREERTIHVVDQCAASDQEGYVGAFRIVSHGSDATTLVPAGKPAAEIFDTLAMSPGPWSMREHEPGRWPVHYTEDLAGKEFVSAELFLLIDPLVSLSTSVAARSWVWSLTAGAVILIVCVLIPRGFCGYICPLGSVIDLFDWSVARRVSRYQVPENGWWVHIKYYLLAGTLVSALLGVMVAGFFAAIPIITRAILFVAEPLQTGMLRGWHLVPRMNLGHFISVGLFLAILALGFLRPRFWCRYVCPSGAIFSLANLLRVSERKVETSCIHCNKCVLICPFDAIKPDFTTRVSDCTFCQSCGGVCPTHAIKFVERWNHVSLKDANDPPTGDTPIGRRGFLSLAAGSTAAVTGGIAVAQAVKVWGAQSSASQKWYPVRPPGSVPERAFLQMCIRCGECFKVCPNNVLQAEGFQQGLEGLWTPLVTADWAGCESSCNACGQVCPTGAIRALPLDEKRVARIALAVVNQQTCLPFANREACQLCVDECHAAGYEAIEFTGVHTQVDSTGHPLEGTGYLAPVVSAEKCVGCGLCQTRCHGINVKQKQLLQASAIIIEAGPGKEDRIASGSYIELRAAQSRRRGAERHDTDESEFFLPDVEPPDKQQPAPSDESGSPFGG